MNLKGNEKNLIFDMFDSVASVFITDVTGRFIYVNDNFCRVSGYSKEELNNQPSSLFKSGIHSEEFYKELWATLKSGKRWKGLFCNKTKSGEFIWLDTIINPILNDNQIINQFIGIRFNVTEEVHNKLKIRTQEEQLVSFSKFATVGEISGFIAHEINNPLTVMSLTANSLDLAIKSENPDITKIVKNIKRIKDVTARIAKISLALRNFSRHESSKREPCKINEILEDALLLIEDIAKSNDVELIIENNVSPDHIVFCHKIQIAQVLINLIKNSCDAVCAQEKREVKVKFDLNVEQLEIRVIDTGIKISDEIATYLFTPYYTTKEKGKGTGIGLTISKRLIEGHGGTMYLDRDNLQTCFVVSIPFRK